MSNQDKEKLLELGMNLAIVGEQVTLAQLVLKNLLEKEGCSLSSPEAVEAVRRCSAVECQFLALEEEYQLCLRSRGGGVQQAEQAGKRP